MQYVTKNVLCYRFLNLAKYFGENYNQFLLAVSFVIARISRSNKLDETWCKFLFPFLLFAYITTLPNLHMSTFGEENTFKSIS